MSMDDKSPTIGDPVEVKLIDRDQGDLWVPATIVSVQRSSICVAFSDGERLAVQSGRGLWRTRR